MCVLCCAQKGAMRMNWSKERSVTLSRCCLIVFALCLLALDVGARWFSMWFCVTMRGMPRQLAVLMTFSIYSGSVFAWLCLYRLWGLLANIRRGDVFIKANVVHMRAISWCCAAAAAICVLSAAYYLPFAFVAVAAGFMALIVRIVKNAFEQAIAMKDELDLTV